MNEAARSRHRPDPESATSRLGESTRELCFGYYFAGAHNLQQWSGVDRELAPVHEKTETTSGAESLGGVQRTLENVWVARVLRLCSTAKGSQCFFSVRDCDSFPLVFHTLVDIYIHISGYIAGTVTVTLRHVALL